MVFIVCKRPQTALNASTIMTVVLWVKLSITLISSEKDPEYSPVIKIPMFTGPVTFVSLADIKWNTHYSKTALVILRQKYWKVSRTVFD